VSEHLDVLVIGAGLSGIGAAYRLQESCPWASYAIFESRDAIGGTWDLFRYPGIRSDSDMFTLGYEFRPWDGAASIADGGSIRQYIVDTAVEAGIDRRIRFGHRVVALEWSSDEARWHVTAERSDTGEAIELTCGFVFSCTGYYRYDRGYTPDFVGLDEFSGQVIHPQHWPDDLDVTGKRVVVVGSGATAITLIPALAGDAAHVTMLQRSPTWVVSFPSRSALAHRLRRVLPSPWGDTAIRWINVLVSQGSYFLSRRWPAVMRKGLRKGLERELPDGYDIDTHFTPRYDPWDQRLCVATDGDLFAAIRSGAASVVTDEIDRFTESGIRLVSGSELDADVVVTATGLEILFIGGIDVSVDGEAVDPALQLMYKGMMVEGVPNLAVAFGYANASWTLKADLTSQYVCRLLNHMRAQGISQCMAVNRTATHVEGSMLGLSSGYLQRAADRMPRQGSVFPWRVHQSYLKDHRALKRSGLTDDAMVFTRSRIPMASGGRWGVV
jgi:monooxygenase